MNKAFRIIWSHARQAFVVTDELASAHGKRGGARLLLAATGAALLATGNPGAVQAADLCTTASTSISTATNDDNCALDSGASVTITDDGSINNSGGNGISADLGFASISNAGNISGSDNGISLWAGETGSTGTLIENSGIISGRNNGISIANGYALGSLTNAGTIQSNSIIRAGVLLDSSTLGNFHNQASGIIENIDSGGAIHLLDSASITNDFVNDGRISGNGAYAAILAVTAALAVTCRTTAASSTKAMGTNPPSTFMASLSVAT